MLLCARRMPRLDFTTDMCRRHTADFSCAIRHADWPACVSEIIRRYEAERMSIIHPSNQLIVLGLRNCRLPRPVAALEIVLPTAPTILPCRSQLCDVGHRHFIRLKCWPTVSLGQIRTRNQVESASCSHRMATSNHDIRASLVLSSVHTSWSVAMSAHAAN